MDIFRSPAHAPPEHVPAWVVVEPMTRRESEVMAELALGHSNAEIGVTLFITEGTVKSHLLTIYDKLNVRTRTEAVVAAQRLGIISEAYAPSPVAAAILILLQTQPSALAELVALGLLADGAP